MTAFGLASRLANPLPFGPPANYQGGIGEDLAELGFGLPEAPAYPDRVPGDGHLILPHVATFQNIINLASRTYYMTYGDALRDNRENARVMRSDAIIMGAMRDRQVPIAQLPWHIEADDEADPYQKLMVDEMKKIVQYIPRFGNFRLNLLEAIWYGKYAVQTAYEWNYARGFKRMMVKDHIPIMGDKITMTFGGRPGILVHGAYQGPRVMTDLGMAHLLSPQEREQFVIHRFEGEDADLFQGEYAGQRFGFGVRDRIYWWWWQRNIVTQWMMDFLQTIGVGGIMIYYYEEGNAASKAAAAEAANNQASSNAILMPRRRNLQGGVDEVTQVERIDASTAGAQLVYDVIVNYFNQAIRDYIMMERLTTRTGNTGLGSNVATAHMDTAGDRKKYDATSLDESITRDLIWVIQRHTFPKCPPERSPLRFVSDVEQRDPVSVMTAAKMLMEMGGTVKEDQVRAAAGLDKPKKGDHTLGGVDPQVPVQQDPNAITEPIPQLDGGRDRHAATRESWETKRGLNPENEVAEIEGPIVQTEHTGKPIRMERQFEETEDEQMVRTEAESTNDSSHMRGEGEEQLLGNGDGSGSGNKNTFAPTSILTPIPVVEGPVVDLSQNPTTHHVPDDLEGQLAVDPLVGSLPLAEDEAYGRSEDQMIPVMPTLPQGMGSRMKARFRNAKKKVSEAQKRVGNYKKKHLRWKGLDISIENVKGSIRSGKSKNGKEWHQKMTADYGYIRRTHSRADGDHIDIFVGPDKSLDAVFVVNQVNPKTGDFDEHKLVVGVPDATAAKELYMSNYEEGWKGFGSIAEMTVDGLKEWLAEGDTSEPALGLVPAQRAVNGTLILMDGTPAPDHIHPASVPQSWTDILLSLNESSPIWMRAKERGERKTVYNPALAPRFARTRDAMEYLKDIPGSTILKMAIDNAVEPPFTRDDMLAALVTRMAARVKPRDGEDNEDHVRRVASAISKQVGVPARTLVEEFISPHVWG